MRAIILTLVASLLPGAAAFAAKSNTVPAVTQEQDQWCWAGVARSALLYFGVDKKQCELAEWTRVNNTANDRNFGYQDCCANPGGACNNWNYFWDSGGSVEEIVLHFGGVTSVRHDLPGGSLSLAQVTAAIDAGKLFFFRWERSNGNGHFLVGYGYDGTLVQYMDPWPGEGSKVAEHTWLVSSTDHTWTSTLVSSGQPAPPPQTNTPPVADAGTNQTVQANATVTLDGSRSSDADGTITRYAWAQTSGSPTVTLSGASAARASFVAPAASGALGFTLTVTDDKGSNHSATVTVTVGSSPPPANKAPVADAGTNQTVQPNAAVTLDGSRSSDPDGTIATYAWAQTSGSPAVTLSGASGARASFVAPAASGALGFTLTVTDDKGATNTATATVTVGGSPPPSSNAPPIAHAGAAQEVRSGDIVTLDGSASSDRDGTIASYAWAQTAGPRVQLSGATGATATFTAPAGPVSLAFELVVTDDARVSGSASVGVRVQSASTVPGTVPGGCSSAGGSGLGAGSLACLLGLLGWRRRLLP